jgi:tRNA dimethylallyltransferase
MSPLSSSISASHSAIPGSAGELPLIVICGATATGKSGLAMALAKRLSGTILSADSRQVYREFDIGTAKPSLSDRQQVPHALIDICEPSQTLTLADYQQRAQLSLSQAAAASTQPLLVGGTGLYIKSLVRGLRIPRVAPQPGLRTQLRELGQPFCHALLRQVDPPAAAKIHPHDQVRTQRALEVFYASGRPISEQQGEQPPSYPILQLGLDCADLDSLSLRIARRTAQMLEQGFVAEVEQLCQKYGPDLPLLQTLGYQEILQHLAGLPLKQAEAEIVLHTRQFAKQQRTWFRADPSIVWFDANAVNLLDQVWEQVQTFRAEQAGDSILGTVL